MKLRKLFIKILLTILVAVLTLPIAPPVSLAKAKLCCKTKCAKMAAMIKAGSAESKHCHHKKNPVDCCAENCSKFITYEKPKTPIANKTRSDKSIGFAPILVWIASLEPSLVKSHSVSHPLKEPGPSKLKNPPLYIVHSKFLI